MFSIVSDSVADVNKRRELYNVIRSCIKMRNRNLKNSCNIDVVFNQYEDFKKKMTPHDQELLKELFVISGHIKEEDEDEDDYDYDDEDADYDEDEDEDEGEDEDEDEDEDILVVSAVGYKTIKIEVGNGKSITLQI